MSLKNKHKPILIVSGIIGFFCLLGYFGFWILDHAFRFSTDGSVAANISKEDQLAFEAQKKEFEAQGAILREQGAAYRIQLDLELIETGAPINFDYMVRCTNIDVPGSFHPIIKGETHFIALSTGAAIAASAPHHYCERSLRGLPFNKPGDPLKMPVVAWYDDVNDLSTAWAYLTNDAYSSPLAKIRFVDFKVSLANKDDYRLWAEKTSQNYKQFGAIPGPFGCMTANALSTEPQSCGYKETVERNGGKQLQVIDDGLLERHLYATPIITDNFLPYIKQPLDVVAFKKEISPNSDIYCPQTTMVVPKTEEELQKQANQKCYTVSGKCPTVKKVKGKDHIKLRKMPFSEEANKFGKIQSAYLRRLKDKRLVNYLDPICLKGEGECDIRKVWPVIPVITDHGPIPVWRMLRMPEYKGFSIQATRGFTPDDFGGFEPTGFRIFNGRTDTGVLFVNDELVCDKYGQVFTFYDFKNSERVKSTTQY